MGWLWKTPPQTPAQAPSPQQPPAPPPANDVDPEIQKFLALFQDDSKKEQSATTQAATSAPSSSSAAAAAAAAASSATSASQQPSKSSGFFSWPSSSSSSSSSSSNSRSIAPSPEANNAPLIQRTVPKPYEPSAQALPPTSPPTTFSESLLPTTMSCRQAFDLAWGCQGPVGQFNAVYRYGTVRSCSEQWDDFWFCMRTKGWGKDAREAAIRDHYRAKEQRKYGGGQPSSEDVWASRDEKVEPGTAFRMRYEKPELSDAELAVMDIERRRRLREGLGYYRAAEEEATKET